VTSRLATDAEVDTWRDQGWVLLEGLVGTEEIDALAEDLHKIFPTAEEHQADPAGVYEQRRGRPKEAEEDYLWPEEGPGFRPAQQRWGAVFPFPGSGVLNRICVHPSVVDFAERALDNEDIRLYQAHASAKYAGITNYEQPIHLDRNHSWLPPASESPWWNLEGFLYLTDVTEEDNPTRMVSVHDTAGIDNPYGVLMPKWNPDVYAAERQASGVRGSYLAYRSNTYHRGAPFGSGTGARIVLALAFKNAATEWIDYDTQQSRSTGTEWTAFVEGSTPRQLALFGWPAPGHAVWDERLLKRTKERYPDLDLHPWRAGLRRDQEESAASPES
jgi:hypothetical protein